MSSEEEKKVGGIVIAEEAVAVPLGEKDFEVPGGKWKHGLCDCFSACACPCLMGWCCFPVLLGQVVERYHKGTPVCMIFLVLWIIVIAIEIIVQVKGRTDYQNLLNDDEDGTITFNFEVAPLWYQICVWFLPLFGWFLFFVACCTRMNMRKKHNLDPACCGDNCCDDCMTTFCCQCCSTIQMERQTHDEDKYPYEMFSRTGLSKDAPEIV